MDANIVLIDWLSITTKSLNEIEVTQLLGMEEFPWELVRGARGYHDRLYFSGVSVHYNGRDDMGVWLEMSGQGCRTFETLGTGDYEKLFRLVKSGHGNITRLDVAYDDHTGVAVPELAPCGVKRSAGYGTLRAAAFSGSNLPFVPGAVPVPGSHRNVCSNAEISRLHGHSAVKVPGRIFSKLRRNLPDT